MAMGQSENASYSEINTASKPQGANGQLNDV